VCEREQEFIRLLLKDAVRLTKVRKLLRRQRNAWVSYGTLRRYAMEKLGFSEPETTIPVMDGELGHELQVDTGWMTYLKPDAKERRRRFRSWIFTPMVSRYRFVYPILEETTETAIEACEAAWGFYGGVFRVLIPDNTKAIVAAADPLSPTITRAFREYSQARGFVVDSTRVRKPRDKARVENAVPSVREDCFGGEQLLHIEAARVHARWWCEEDYGRTPHRTTRREPREHFVSEEQVKLLVEPTERYDIPSWSEPVVKSDQMVPVVRGLYSVPTRYVGQKLLARADGHTVRFYVAHEVVKVHSRVDPGKKSVDASDYPPEKAIYAFRNGPALIEMAMRHGESVGRYAAALLEGPEPWARMRRAYALVRLVKKYGPARVEETCRIALAAEMIDVKRLGQMLEAAQEVVSAAPASRSKVVPIARFLRPASHFALRGIKGGKGGAQ
jgi:transposase